MKLHPVIMCGGAGSRLWPLSRAASPKQFLNLLEDQSLLSATAARLAASSLDMAPPVVICGKGQEETVKAQMCSAGLPPSRMIVEPFGRSTAAVTAVATLEALKADPEACILLLPADHFVSDTDGFWNGVAAGIKVASEGYIVTLGIEPTSPETGYGYIQRGDPIEDGVYSVRKFKEKPDLATAQSYLATGEYSWNAGIFLFKAASMQAAFAKHAPDVWAACDAACTQGKTGGEMMYLDAGAFDACPDVPVDIAIMEQASRVAIVAPVRAGWNDVGSWDAIAELKQSLGTSTPDPEQTYTLDCENCLVETDGPFVAAIGLDNVIIVASGDSVLVIDRSRAQDVKQIVAELKARQRKDLL